MRIEPLDEMERVDAVRADQIAPVDCRDIRGDGAKARLGVLDEVGVDRPARHGFDAQGTRAGEQIEHAGVDERWRNDAHPRFADAICRWANGTPVGRHQPSPLPSSCHDTHATAQTRKSRSFACSRDTPWYSSRSSR